MSMRTEFILFLDGDQSSKNTVLCSIKISLNKRTRGHGRDYIEYQRQCQIAKPQTENWQKPQPVNMWPNLEQAMENARSVPTSNSERTKRANRARTTQPHTTIDPQPVFKPAPILKQEPVLPRPVQMWPNLEQKLPFIHPVPDAATENSEESAEFEWGGKKVDEDNKSADMKRKEKRKRNLPDDYDTDDNLEQMIPDVKNMNSGQKVETEWGPKKLEEYKKRAIPVELQKRNAPDDDESASDDGATPDDDADKVARDDQTGIVPSAVSVAQIPGHNTQEYKNKIRHEVQKANKVDSGSSGDGQMGLVISHVVSKAPDVTHIKKELDNEDVVMETGDNVEMANTNVGGHDNPKPEPGLKHNVIRRSKFHEHLAPQQCEVCKEEFANIYLLQIHLDNTHFWCTKCQCMLKTKCQFLKHQARNVKCNLCNKVFCTYTDQKEHWNKVHYNPSECDVCHVKFKSKWGMEQHQKESCECKECNKKFCFKKDYTHHMSMVHVRSKKCSKCPCLFSTEAQLEKHMERHNYIECDICGKMSKGRAHLKTHKLRIHSGDALSPCDVCGKQYKGLKSLEEHKVTDHGAEGKFKCDKCGKQFLTKQRFEMHMRIHTGEKPYQCSTCGKSYSLASSLYVHSKTHTTERLYKCTKCDASYTTKYYLKAHMDKHDPTKAVQCEICFKMFRTRDLLKVHSEIHMNRRKYKCDICGVAYNNSGSLYTHKKKHRERSELF